MKKFKTIILYSIFLFFYLRASFSLIEMISTIGLFITNSVVIFINIFPLLIGLIGIIKSCYKKFQLNYLIEFTLVFYSITEIPFFLHHYINSKYLVKSEIDSMTIIGVVIALIVTILLILWKKDHQKSEIIELPRKSKQFILNKEQFDIDNSSNILLRRFLNYIIDLYIIILIGSPLAISIALKPGNSDQLLYLVIFVVSIIYYIGFESLTCRTPGKILTNTVIQFNSQNRFLASIKRTFSRLIPFEVFSYVGSNFGWHDSLSQTYVEKNPSESIFY